MMSNTVKVLDVSLSESGGADVFTSTSAVYVINAVQTFNKKRIKDFATPAAFPDDGTVNVNALQRSFNKPAIAEWLGTALDILDRAVIQIEAAKKLESQISCAAEENRDLMKNKIQDQHTIIDLFFINSSSAARLSWQTVHIRAYNLLVSNNMDFAGLRFPSREQFVS